MSRGQGADSDSSDQPSSPYEQALLNYKSAKYPAAKICILQAEKETPDSVPIEMLKARIEIEEHDFAGARHVLDTLYARTDLTPAYGQDLTLTAADLSLRQRKFEDASKLYLSYLDAQPADADAKLKLVYARLSVGDLVTAGRYASELKPLDTATPAYYFAQAALAHASGTGNEQQDIEQSRTLYGITATNRYLKTYLEVFSSPQGADINGALNPPTGRPSPPTPNPVPAAGVH